MIIESQKQILKLRSKIYENADKTYRYILQDIANKSALDLFADIKFNKIGVDPINGSSLNFIEQLNQTFSDLVVLSAVEALLSKYPDKQFEITMGAKAGFDIQSCDGAVVAECFAVTSIGSNSKLRKDAKKLMESAPDRDKYIFFYSQNDNDDKLKNAYDKFPEIVFERVKEF